MSARAWVLAVAAALGMASAGWAQGPGGKHCGGGGGGGQGQLRSGGQGMMRGGGGGGPGMMRSGGGGTLTANPAMMQQMQLQAQMAQLQQLQAQQLALGLADASAVGRANFARMQAAKKARQAQLQAGN